MFRTFFLEIVVMKHKTIIDSTVKETLQKISGERDGRSSKLAKA